MSRLIGTWERGRSEGDIPVSPTKWEAQYAAGAWDYLGDLKELGRYSVVAGYIRFLKPGGAVLNVGCGAGTLLGGLDESAYSRFVGIDISETAIRKASSRSSGKAAFVCADAETYQPGESFDVIVFNETLYYFEAPLECCRRYESFLRKDGIVITCLYGLSARARGIQSQLTARYPSLDEVVIRNDPHYWVCNVFTPGGAGS
jgi:2-polyprenyl-6-hydroxyphenyl methylase/3-demethylubiquinone-9 3-methyltransferase